MEKKKTFKDYVLKAVKKCKDDKAVIVLIVCLYGMIILSKSIIDIYKTDFKK